MATSGILNDNIELIKNMPSYQVHDVKVRNTGINAVYNPNITLGENMPHYSISDRKSRNIATNGILDDNINLTENIPHHIVTNNKGYNTGERIILNDEIVLTENLPRTMMQSAKTKNIKADISSMEFNRLHETINPGSMEGRVIIPTSDRNMNYNSNYTTNKRELAQKIMRERV
jgi:hypothetical protein